MPEVSHDFDPFGQVARAVQNRSHVFLPENNLNLLKLNAAKKALVQAKPSNFKPGCLVEAQVSFCIVKSEGKRAMKILVREMLLQENSFALVGEMHF